MLELSRSLLVEGPFHKRKENFGWTSDLLTVSLCLWTSAGACQSCLWTEALQSRSMPNKVQESTLQTMLLEARLFPSKKIVTCACYTFNRQWNCACRYFTPCSAQLLIWKLGWPYIAKQGWSEDREDFKHLNRLCKFNCCWVDIQYYIPFRPLYTLCCDHHSKSSTPCHHKKLYYWL